MSRKGARRCVIGVVREDDHELLDVVDHAITIPRTIDMLTPILAPRHQRGPAARNLAKSVTVE